MSRGCDYCGLALPPTYWGRDDADIGPAYCCFGCRFAHSVARERAERAGPSLVLARLGLAIFFAMNVMAFTMTLWSTDVYGVDPEAGRTATLLHGLFRWLCMLFAVPVLVLLGGPLAMNALDALRHGRPNIDLLLLPGVVAAYVWSIVSVFRDDGPIYFEVGVVVLVFVTLGRWLEATGKARAAAALDGLRKLLPESAVVVREGAESVVPLAEVGPGDQLRVRAGERIACDGRVIASCAAVDEQLITGESEPQPKRPGDRVIGGTLALDGDLTIEATASPDGGHLGQLVALVRAAGLSQGKYQRLADRVAARFLPLVAVLALGVTVVHARHGGFPAGLTAGLSVLVIACPCALGVATPLATWVAVGRLARQGVLVRTGDTLERLAEVRTALFDKTGTLTQGVAVVTEMIAEPSADRGDVLRRAVELAGASNHPAARAIARSVAQVAPLPGVRTTPGCGVTDPTSGAVLGRPDWLTERGLHWPARLIESRTRGESAGRSIVAVGWDGLVRGLFVLSEQLRDDLPDLLRQLDQLAVRSVIVTGDTPQRGHAIAEQLGIEVRAGLRPEDKVAVMESVRAAGPVAVIGDGLNDAPALAHADVGVAMGCGTDVARASASVCLLGDDLRLIPTTIALARRTVRVVRRNLVWALAYNVVGLLWACTGTLNPVVAAVAMALSSGFVIGNSLRLSHA